MCSEEFVTLAIAWNEGVMPLHELRQIRAHAFAECGRRILPRSEPLLNIRGDRGRIKHGHPKSPRYLVGGLGIDCEGGKHVDGPPTPSSSTAPACLLRSLLRR